MTQPILHGRVRPKTPPESQPKTPSDAKPKANRRAWWLLAGLLVVAAGIGLYYRQSAPAPAPQEKRHGVNPADAVQPVGVATAASSDVSVIFDALGTVTPIYTVTVTSQIAGYLQEVAFKEGQDVKKGDFLAQIDPRPYEALKAQYEGQLLHDQGFLDQAKADLIRYQALMKQDSISRQQGEDQVYVVTQYQGSVKSDQAQVDAQKLNLVYCHIVSPITGRVGLRLVDPGNYVQPSNTTGLAVITQLDPISVIFIVPEDQLPAITEELNAGHELVTVAYDRANQHQLATGHVTVLDNQVDTTTGTVKLRAEFPNPDRKLFPSQFVNIRLLIRTLNNVITVPTAAIQRGAPGTYVYLVDDDKVAARPVKLGVVDGDKVQIESGLAAGDRVVIDGADRLRDGARITIPTAADQQPAPKDNAKSHDHKGRPPAQ
ncbi:MAG: efflux RND transporter periplasmic adaptor subunit [Beijerinckiaceae bacterium]